MDRDPHITEGNDPFATVILEEDTEVRGFDLSNTVNSPVISANGVDLGVTTIDDVSILAGSSEGIELNSTTGSIDLTNIAIDVFGVGFDVFGGDPNVTYDGTIISEFQDVIRVNSTSGGSISFLNGPFTATNSSPAIRAISVPGSLSIDNVSLPGGPGGVQIQNSDGTFTFTNLDIDNVFSVPFDVDGGAPNVSVDVSPPTITNSQNPVLTIRNTTGGSVDFTGGSITDTGGNGIVIEDAVGAVSIANTVTITNPNTIGAAAGVYLNNVAGDVTFGDLNMTTTDVPGLLAAGGSGLLTITSGVIDATNSAAVDASGHSLDVSLASVSSSNSTDVGIRLASSSGTFTSTGGLIDDPFDVAFRLNVNSGLAFAYGGNVTSLAGTPTSFIEGLTNTAGSSFQFDGNLTHVNATPSAAGILLVGNTGSVFTFNGTVDVTTDDVALSAVGGGTVEVLGADNKFTSGVARAVYLVDLEGTSIIDNSSITSSGASGSADGFLVGQTVGASTVQVYNSSIDANGFDGMFVTATGGDLTVDLSGTSITNNNDAGFHAQALVAGSITLNVDDVIGPNIFSNKDYGIHVEGGGTAVVDFTIDGNQIDSSNQYEIVVDYGATGAGTTGAIRQNTIDGAGLDGIVLLGDGDGLGTFEIDSNTLIGIANGGILANTSSSVPGNASDLSLTLVNNQIEVTEGGIGIWLDSNETGRICTQVGGSGQENAFTFTGSSTGTGIIAQLLNDNGTFQVEGLALGPLDEIALGAQLATDNTFLAGIPTEVFVLPPGNTLYTGISNGTCRDVP